ncbi:ABC transporter ATP-binding protein, partial [Enterococcus cecorum]
MIGFIGENGSGKSTLLKIITGVLTPTSGEMQINGNIAALLELGSGFNPEYSGYDNIYLNGMVLGFTKEQVDGMVDDIISFADIGDHLYQPVKTYSSGMF